MTVFEARKAAQDFLADPIGSADRGLFAPFIPHDPNESEVLRASPSPRLDAEVILASVLERSRSALIAHPELSLGDKETAFRSCVARRATGLPVAYVIGIREFWGLSFRVTQAVLIPKQDTEILVERALEIIRTKRQTNPAEPIRVIDVCTGSGCIAISIKHAIPSVEMAATDISEEALSVARDNAARLLTCGGEIDGAHGEAKTHVRGNCAQSPTITFSRGDLRDGIPEATQGWDLVVSNPPYVPDSVAHGLLSDGRGEPLLALAGGSDGLDLVRALARVAKPALARGGILLVETGEYNAGEAAEYFRELGYSDVVIHRDLEGQERVVEGTAL
jgi:release factor glutamine methyltransferase